MLTVSHLSHVITTHHHQHTNKKHTCFTHQQLVLTYPPLPGNTTLAKHILTIMTQQTLNSHFSQPNLELHSARHTSFWNYASQTQPSYTFLSSLWTPPISSAYWTYMHRCSRILPSVENIAGKKSLLMRLYHHQQTERVQCLQKPSAPKEPTLPCCVWSAASKLQSPYKRSRDA